MIDSSGVVASGVAKGNYQFMGDFDECLDIDVKLSSDETIDGFYGQYCTLDLPIKASIGICLPSACTQKDIIAILSTCKGRIKFFWESFEK